MRVGSVALIAILVLMGACGGSSDEPEAGEPSESAPTVQEEASDLAEDDAAADAFQEALDKAEEAAAVCKDIVKDDPTYPKRYDDFDVFCFAFDVVDVFESNPAAEVQQIGKQMADKAIEQQKKDRDLED